jgi:hypothetical protein
MNNRIKHLFRASGLLHQAVLRRRGDPTGIWLPEQRWSDCVSALRRIRRATEHGWHRAAAQACGELLYRVDQCRNDLHEASLGLQQNSSAGKIPSQAHIFRELMAVDSEFDDLTCDFEAEELCVTTPSVTLEGISLGRFEIRLHWNQRDNPLAYRVIALDPNPAVSNESIMHPHVSGEEAVCEGDGRPAIRAALNEGRLADFFLLVWRLLDTYAPGRAFVELRDWFGVSCHECGTHLHEDDRCTCSRCDELFCSECMCICSHCDDVFCAGCISRCQNCDGKVCGSCRRACAICGSIVCPECLSDEGCPTCREDLEAEDDDSNMVDQPQMDAANAPPNSSLIQASGPAGEGIGHV